MADWKSNPVITAAISGGVVLTATLAVCFNYIIPTYLKESQNALLDSEKKTNEANNKIKSLEANIESINIELSEKVLKDTYDLSLKIRELKSELELSKSELELSKSDFNSVVEKLSESEKSTVKIKNDFFKYTIMNGFMANSPYPIGYSKIKIGSTLSEFYETYKKPEIFTESDSDYLSIKPSTGPVGEISYQFNKKTNKAESIVFSQRMNLYSHGDPDISYLDINLSSLLTDVMGKPFSCEEKPNFKYWKLNDGSGYLFSMGLSYHYIILANGFAPSVWPRTCPPNKQEKTTESFFPHIFPLE